MLLNDPRHGTRSGYLVHTREGSLACEPCREANRNYTNEYRGRNPEIRAKSRQYNKARWRALLQLSRRHPEEFNLLMLEQIKRQAELGSAPDASPGSPAAG